VPKNKLPSRSRLDFGRKSSRLACRNDFGIQDIRYALKRLNIRIHLHLYNPAKNEEALSFGRIIISPLTAILATILTMFVALSALT